MTTLKDFILNAIIIAAVAALLIFGWHTINVNHEGAFSTFKTDQEQQQVVDTFMDIKEKYNEGNEMVQEVSGLANTSTMDMIK